MVKQRKAVIEGNAMSRIAIYTLGGVEQKILSDGKSAEINGAFGIACIGDLYRHALTGTHCRDNTLI